MERQGVRTKQYTIQGQRAMQGRDADRGRYAKKSREEFDSYAMLKRDVKGRQPAKQAKKTDKLRVLKIFFGTFIGVLLGGVMLLLIVSVIRMNAREVKAAPGEEVSSVSLLWENVEETFAEVVGLSPDSAEVTATEEETVAEPEDIVAPGGRILQKNLPLSTTDEDGVSLLFAGDILFDDQYSPMAAMRQRGSIEACFSPETLQVMREADIFMLNNEFTYTNGGTPTPGKTFTFRAHPENVQLLDVLGVDIVSLANNHAYDYGEVSLLDTMGTLNGAGMPFVGAGTNLEDATQTFYFQLQDMKLAYVSATMIERTDHPDTKGATDSTPGVFRCLNEERLLQEVAKAKQNADFVVAYIHWGTESTTDIDWMQQKVAPELANAGADVIMGDHPHVLQGIYVYNGVPCIYSLGNYWFNSGTQNTGLIRIVLKDGKMAGYQFVPARQSGNFTEVLTGDEKMAGISYMQSLSPGVILDTEGYIHY